MPEGAQIPAAIIGRLSRSVQELMSEVETLARSIADTRSELRSLDAGPFVAGHIPAAADELDAVVAHTASATERILLACETLENAGAAPDPDMLRRETARIYEACGFQDVTGQRIMKVVATLKAIESKVLQMLAVFGAGHPAAPPFPPAELLNGPQLPGRGMDQADIDRMLNA